MSGELTDVVLFRGGGGLDPFFFFFSLSNIDNAFIARLGLLAIGPFGQRA